MRPWSQLDPDGLDPDQATVINETGRVVIRPSMLRWSKGVTVGSVDWYGPPVGVGSLWHQLFARCVPTA